MAQLAGALCAGVLAYACSTSTPPNDEQARVSPEVGQTLPADYISPGRFDTVAEMVPQRHSVIEGKVDFERYDFDDCWGPRTVLKVSQIEPVVGAPPGSAVDLYVFGGPLPDGSFMEVSELPRFVSGDRYVLFLRNTDWRYSPVMGAHAYRVTSMTGKRILLDSEGNAVVKVGPNGVEVGSQAFTEPVGLRLRGPASKEKPSVVPEQPKEAGCVAGGSACSPIREIDPRTAFLTMTSGKLEAPKTLSNVPRQAVGEALSREDFRKGLARMVESSGASVGGKFLDRPRYDCWRTSPTVPERRSYGNLFTR